MPTPPRLDQLFHHRWTVPLLAALQRTAGAKLITLVNRLGVSRGALRQALRAAIADGWVECNPGYGHPLRPEYILTAAGANLAPRCLKLFDFLDSAGLRDIGLRKWSLATLAAIDRRGLRFSQISEALPGATDRALAQTLKQVQAAGLIRRVVHDAYPPIVEYGLAPRARKLAEILRSF